MFYRFCDIYAKFLNYVITFLGTVLLIAVGLQVAGRYIPFVPMWLWPLEFTNISLIWSIFVGSIIAVRHSKHFFVDVFGMGGRQVNPKVNVALRVLYYFSLSIMIYVFTYYGWFYFKDWGMIQHSEITGMNMGWLYASVPFAGVSWLLFMIEGIAKELSGKSVGEANLDLGPEDNESRETAKEGN